ncbi:MAG: GtrA family protein [Candidatus Omnitrophica bacterium]|nr:GtrA family protein [Candidatus Omnitrophota bacterium]
MKIDMNTKTEIIRFSMVGAFVIATDFSIYYLLFHFLPYSIAKGISFTCAGIAGYLLNKYWTFKHGERSYAEIGRYTFINVLALGINVVTNQSILNLRPGAVWPALIMATAVTSFLTFIFFKWWVFKVNPIWKMHPKSGQR